VIGGARRWIIRDRDALRAPLAGAVIEAATGAATAI
jgi:hypothetical protein